MLPTSSAGLVLGWLLLAVVSPEMAVEGQPAASGFSWKSTYADALKAAAEHDLLVAVYFRPVVGAEPLALRRAPATKGLERVISGVRVGPAEVLELKERLAVSRFPALVVLDARETVLLHWQETIPLDVWKRVVRTFRQLEESYARQQKDVEIVREQLDSGHADSAYRRLGPLLRSRRTAPSILRTAKELERRVIEAGEERLLDVLAAEGLVPDEQLRERLAALFSDPVPAQLREARDRELRRLEATTIGGRTQESTRLPGS